eukprot:GHVN01012864.1.p2 GENE.GHVN01012864.1~~GHVN01012864.1.p2  ORF type:complete len:364 (+),score=107.25 GHVN01012864.1:1816-2907(+)
MAPKKDVKSERGVAKAEEKAKQKVAEDKTFGLKNKNKSKAVQKYIKGVQTQAAGNPKDLAAKAKAKEASTEAKKKQAERDALLRSLFGAATAAKKIGEGTAEDFDPKQCRADQKIDLYSDAREMDDWTLEKLEEVILDKHGETNKGLKETTIVCKHFLEALDKRQYGWFWTCPGGGDKCIYRHCLPKGYVLKKDRPKDDDDEEEPLEEAIERERAELSGTGTPVTLESFEKWKKEKEAARVRAVEAERVKAAKKTGGRGLEILSGRDLFSYDPTLFVDDDGAADEMDYEEDEEEEAERHEREEEESRRAQAEATSATNNDDDDNDDERDGGEESEGSLGAERAHLFLEEGNEPDLDDLDDLDE